MILRTETPDGTRIAKVVSGTTTQISNTNPVNWNQDGDTLRFKANGSNLTVFRNGVSIVGPISDTSITGILQVGFISGGSDKISSKFDDFKGGDLLSLVALERGTYRGIGRGVLAGV